MYNHDLRRSRRWVDMLVIISLTNTVVSSHLILKYAGRKWSKGTGATLKHAFICSVHHWFNFNYAIHSGLTISRINWSAPTSFICCDSVNRRRNFFDQTFSFTCEICIGYLCKSALTLRSWCPSVILESFVLSYLKELYVSDASHSLSLASPLSCAWRLDCSSRQA